MAAPPHVRAHQLWQHGHRAEGPDGTAVPQPWTSRRLRACRRPSPPAQVAVAAKQPQLAGRARTTRTARRAAPSGYHKPSAPPRAARHKDICGGSGSDRGAAIATARACWAVVPPNVHTIMSTRGWYSVVRYSVPPLRVQRSSPCVRAPVGYIGYVTSLNSGGIRCQVVRDAGEEKADAARPTERSLSSRERQPIV